MSASASFTEWVVEEAALDWLDWLDWLGYVVVELLSGETRVCEAERAVMEGIHVSGGY